MVCFVHFEDELVARLQNERNRPSYHFECSIFDLLHGLRTEYDHEYNYLLKKSRTGSRGVKVSHEKVAHRYDGCSHSTNSYVRQAVIVASTLSQRTIAAIGHVCNTDCSDIMVDKESNDETNFKSAKDARLKHDYLLFKNFVRFGALRSSKAFINAVSDNNEEAQVNTIY